MILVVGLGNPGMKYKNTYHNVGFMAIDALAKRLKVKFDKTECDARTCKGNYKGVEFVFAKPETYMNLSGEAVKKLVARYDVDVTRELIVCYDDVDLPIGKLRIREEGSAGTHNGMRSVIGLLGRQEDITLPWGDLAQWGEDVILVNTEVAIPERPSLLRRLLGR